MPNTSKRGSRDPKLMAAVEKAARAMGSKYKLNKALGMSEAAIYFWRRIPAERVKQVSALTGIPKEELRPDLYE